MRTGYLFLILFLLIGCGQQSGDSNSTLGSLDQGCGSMNAEACDAFEQVNIQRLQAGLSPLSVNENCVDASQIHAEDMDENNYFSHDSPTETWQERLTRFGVTGARAENISGNPTAKGAVQNWMNSTGHRNNILNPEYSSAGMGYINSLWVQCFSSH